MTKEDRIKAAEAAYPEFPNGGIENRNRDIHCHKKRKAFIKGGEAEAESNQKIVELFRYFIRTNHLTDDWQKFLENNTPLNQQ